MPFRDNWRRLRWPLVLPSTLQTALQLLPHRCLELHVDLQFPLEYKTRSQTIGDIPTGP